MTDRQPCLQGISLQSILARLNVDSGPDSKGNYTAWCPFHADGQGKPPHRPNLHVSERGFNCFACNEKGSLKKLGRHLGVITSNDTDDQREITYDYNTEDGSLLYQAVRRPGKKFLQRRPDGSGGWIWNLKDTRRVLYHLPALIAREDEIVFIVEGEKDADTLIAAGLLATTNSGGAGKWHDEYSDVLKERDVVIVPDNDKTGRDHAGKVARSLHGKANSIKIVNLPGLPIKGDVSDWLAQDHTLDELHDIVADLPQWEPSENDDVDENGQESAGERESLSVKIVRLALDSEIELFHDERSDPYAAISVQDGRKIRSLDSRDFFNWLNLLTWQEFVKAPGREVFSAARQVLSSMALFDGKEHPLHNRCANHEDSIWIDLDGRKAVRVDPGRWEIIENPPILFRYFPHQRPLPDPVRTGDLSKILDFVNLKGDDSKILLLCYLVAAMVPDIPVAALVVHGVQGAAKTTFLKVVRRVLDPSLVEIRGGVRDLTEFAQAAAQNRILFFDNLSSIPYWLSDAFCRAVTGESWAKRKLYTDEESTLFKYRGVIGLAGINLVANRPDLLDRSLIIPLESIPPHERREETEFWQAFEEARPKILGGLLSVLADAMRIRHEITITHKPRMADFARYGAAAAKAMGRSPEDFLDAYDRNVGRQNEAAIEASAVAQAILAFMQDTEAWQGTASELLDHMEKMAEDLHINVKGNRSWPKSPSALSRRLREVLPNLHSAGIEALDDRDGQKRSIALRKLRKNAVIAVTAVTDVNPQGVTRDGKMTACDGIDVPHDGNVTASDDTSRNAVIPNPLNNNGADGNDDNDGISAAMQGVDDTAGSESGAPADTDPATQDQSGVEKVEETEWTL